MEMANNVLRCNNAIQATTVADEIVDIPIKMSVIKADDGQFHLKYDQCDSSDENELENGSTSSRSRSRRVNSKKATQPKITTETLYEIDLFCNVCNHEYKSLMSLNRHMKTRKHLNQVAKLNPVNEQRHTERDWKNYESYLSAYELMPREVYNSIVRTLLEDTDTNGHHDGKRKTKKSIDYLCNEFNDLCTNHSDHSSDDTNFYHSHFDQMSLNRSPTVIKCMVCNDKFSSLQLLQKHIQESIAKCSDILDRINDNFNFDLYLD